MLDFSICHCYTWSIILHFPFCVCHFSPHRNIIVLTLRYLMWRQYWSQDLGMRATYRSVWQCWNMMLSPAAWKRSFNLLLMAQELVVLCRGMHRKLTKLWMKGFLKVTWLCNTPPGPHYGNVHSTTLCINCKLLCLAWFVLLVTPRLITILFLMAVFVMLFSISRSNLQY